MSRLTNGRGEVKRPVGRGRFADRPGMAIDAQHARRFLAAAGPRGSRGTGAATEIDQRRTVRRRRRQLLDDVRDEEIVERTVEQRKGRALAGPGERRPLGELLPPLDVRGRQRAQRARDFRKRQVARCFASSEAIQPANDVG